MLKEIGLTDKLSNGDDGWQLVESMHENDKGKWTPH
jgi:hypothetical protein